MIRMWKHARASLLSMPVTVRRITSSPKAVRGLVCLVGLIASSTIQSQPAADQAPGDDAARGILRVIEIQGKGVEILRKDFGDWTPAATGNELRPGDQMRTREFGRIMLQAGDDTVLHFGGPFHFVVEPPRSDREKPGFSLLRGLMYLFHRGKPEDVRVGSRIISSLVRGTEFNLLVGEDDRTALTLLNGEVDLFSPWGDRRLTSAEQCIVERGHPPAVTAVIDAVSVIQWALYYPAVVDLQELPLSAGAQTALAESLAAYRKGDLLQAQEKYPTDRNPEDCAERVYLAALLLSVGHVEQAVGLLDQLDIQAGPAGNQEDVLRLAKALRQVISAVKGETFMQARMPVLASEWLAESYDQQSLAKLPEALQAARRAVLVSPQFGFGWARVAELEFSFGNIRKASEALQRSLELAPDNPQAWSLMGFLLAGDHQIQAAIRHFNHAIQLDSALGNAWLGRGLCRINQGDSKAGRRDLLIAAALEPQRSVLRSYLAKAYLDTGEKNRAEAELDRARDLDDADPTVWLYSALMNHQYNRINRAIRELERSQALNQNRQVYRSRLLLDQDRAVRSANLARIYEDAGMMDFGVWEASRAVTADYANYSAHLFLANSYDQLRDPKLINLRYETATDSEYLVANLLAPVAAGPFSSTVSQQEYSQLFERNRLGLVSSTEYSSDGGWIQKGAQYGILGDLSYSLNAFYRTEDGQRPNNDLEQLQLALQLRLQATPQDSVFFEGAYADQSGGDLFQYYDQNDAARHARTSELQAPFLTFGYHREWSPGQHTLALAGWLNDEFELVNPTQPTLYFFRFPDGSISSAVDLNMNERLRVQPKILSLELQHIAQVGEHTTIVGARYQHGEFETANLQSPPISRSSALFDNPPADQRLDPAFERAEFYAYHHWQVVDSLQLVAGVSYDYIRFPENVRLAPVSRDTGTIDGVLPKVGFVWNPWPQGTLRGAYTRSLSSTSLEQSYTLEPTQIAGFLQSYRSILPESIAGANAGAKFETAGAGLEQRFNTGTYLGLEGRLLKSKFDRTCRCL